MGPSAEVKWRRMTNGCWEHRIDKMPGLSSQPGWGQNLWSCQLNSPDHQTFQMSKPVVPLVTWGKPEPSWALFRNGGFWWFLEIRTQVTMGFNTKMGQSDLDILDWGTSKPPQENSTSPKPRNWMLFTEEMRMVVSWRTLPPNHDRTMPWMGTAGPCFIMFYPWKMDRTWQNMYTDKNEYRKMDQVVMICFHHAETLLSVLSCWNRNSALPNSLIRSFRSILIYCRSDHIWSVYI